MINLSVVPVSKSKLGKNDKKRYEVRLHHKRDGLSHKYKNVIVRAAFPVYKVMPNAKIVTNNEQSMIEPKLGTEKVLKMVIPEKVLSKTYSNRVPSNETTPIYSVMIEINTGVPTLEDTTPLGDYTLEVQMEFNDVLRTPNLQVKIPVTVA